MRKIAYAEALLEEVFKSTFVEHIKIRDKELKIVRLETIKDITEGKVSWRTVKRAKANLRISSVKQGFPSQVIGWSLPSIRTTSLPSFSNSSIERFLYEALRYNQFRRVEAIKKLARTAKISWREIKKAKKKLKIKEFWSLPGTPEKSRGLRRQSLTEFMRLQDGGAKK